jgi:hypothetical protein
VLPSAVATIPVALWSGRLMTQIGLTTAAVLWLITGGLAYRAARRRDFTAHRDWMTRNYALTFLAVTARILVPLLLLVQLPFRGADPGSMGELATSMIPIGQTMGWVVNLVVVESVIRRRRRCPKPVCGTHDLRRPSAPTFRRRPESDRARVWPLRARR